MNTGFSRFAKGVLVVAALILMSGRSWGIFDELGPSKDEWKLKYNVELTPAAGDTVTVAFTLADEGRLKPVYSATVVAFSKQTDSQGGRSYDVKAPIKLTTTEDGTRVGEVQIRKEFVDRAMIRILTQSVDGRRPKTSSAAYYDIPLKKYRIQSRAAASTPAPTSVANPPALNVTK